MGEKNDHPERWLGAEQLVVMKLGEWRVGPEKTVQMSVVRTIDLDNQPVAIPYFGEVKGQAAEVQMADGDREYLVRALTLMSPLLAVEATYNMDPRPDLDRFAQPVVVDVDETEVKRLVPPMIFGVTGLSGTGKTTALAMLAKMNEGMGVGVINLDPFSKQSLAEQVEYIEHPGVVELARAEAVAGVQAQVAADNMPKNMSGVTLRGILKDWVMQCQQGGYMFMLADLPGTVSTPRSVFDLLQYAVFPTRDLGRKAVNNKTGEVVGKFEADLGDAGAYGLMLEIQEHLQTDWGSWVEFSKAVGER
jgi:hypothetical protein